MISGLNLHPKRKYHKNIAIKLSFPRHVLLLSLTTYLIFLFSIPVLRGQDLRYSQWHAAETTVNPAFAGSSAQPRVILNFRDQWPNMPQTYISYRAAFDGYVDAIRSGIGVYIDQDVQGDGALQVTHFGLQYMYQARLGNNWALNMGMQLAYSQYKLNWQELQFLDQISILTGFNDAAGNPNPTGEPVPGALTTGFADVNAGALLYSNNLYLGMSVGHITSPEVSFYDNAASTLPISFSAQTGVFIGGDKKDALVFNPYALFTAQDGFSQIQTGFYVKKGIFLTGLAFKHNTSNLSDVVLLAGLSKGLVKFAYSYDVSTGPLSGLTGGAHEVSLMLTFKDNPDKSRKNNQKSMLDCPSIL